MNGITSLHGMNKRCEETNYCAFDDDRKLKATKGYNFIYAKSDLKLLYSLFLRWWLSNVKCQTSNLVSDSSDQKLTVAPSLTRARNIMIADAQSDYLNDYWTNCKTATQNLSGDVLRCYDLLFIPLGKFKPLICKMPLQWRVNCSPEMWLDVYGLNTP